MLLDLARKGLVDVLAANFIAQAVGFVVLLALPRFLDPHEFGSIRVLQSTGDLLVIFGGFGYNTAVLVTAAGSHSREQAEWILRTATKRTLLASGAVWILSILVSLLGVLGGTPLAGRWLPLYALAVPAFALTLLLAAWLQANSRLREMARTQTLARILAAVLVMAATWRFGVPGFVAGTVVAAFAGMALMLRQVSTSFLRSIPDTLPFAFDRYARQSLAANLFQAAGRYADLLILGLFATASAELGPYAIATVLVIPVFVFAGAVQATCIPGFSARRREIHSLRMSVDRLQVETMLAAAAIAIAIWFAAQPVLSALYPPSYAAALPVIAILLLHSVLRAGTSVYGAGQIAIGRPDLNALASAFSAVAGLAAGYYGLRFGGLVGLAWAQAAVSAALVIGYPVLFRAGLGRIAADCGPTA